MNQEEVKMQMDFGDDQLKDLSNLVEDLLKNEKAIEDLMSALATLKQQQKQLSEIDIPTKMKDIGMQEFVTSQGDKVKIKSFYSGYIPTLKACLKSQELAERRQKCLDTTVTHSSSSASRSQPAAPVARAAAPPRRTSARPSRLRPAAAAQLRPRAAARHWAAARRFRPPASATRTAIK